MIILGIDPGTATTGFSIIDKKNGALELKTYGCIKTKSNLSDASRLTEIANDLNEIIKEWKPDIAAIEKIFFQTNVKTAISVAQARGVILEILNRNNIKIIEYTPLEMKSFLCGNGSADKKMVQKMVQLILGLEAPPKPDDAADAIGMAICAANNLEIELKI